MCGEGRKKEFGRNVACSGFQWNNKWIIKHPASLFYVCTYIQCMIIFYSLSTIAKKAARCGNQRSFSRSETKFCLKTFSAYLLLFLLWHYFTYNLFFSISSSTVLVHDFTPFLLSNFCASSCGLFPLVSGRNSWMTMAPTMQMLAYMK